MKIRVYADDFKNAIQKIAPVIPKRTALESLKYIRLQANFDSITLYATDVENAVSVTIPGVVLKDGYVDVRFDDLKKITNIKDDVVITSTSVDDATGTIEFRSSKKTYTVTCRYFENIHTFTDCEFTSCVEIPESIMADLKPLATMASANEADGMMTALFFDMENSRIITLDGHRIGIQNMDTSVVESFMAPAKIVPIMKSLIGKTENDTIKVEIGKKTICYTGYRFTCWQRRLEGQYYNVQNILKTSKENYKSTFTVGNKEISEIAKEYKKVLTADEKKPMIITESHGVICTGIRLQTYQTSDALETANIKYHSGDFFVGLNPSFILDAATFIKDDMEFRINSCKSPVYIRSEDGKKECVILPVNIGSTGLVEFVRKQAC